MGLSLRNITHKIWDQVNMADNGRTWSNPNPTNHRSILGQIAATPEARVVNRRVIRPTVSNARSIAQNFESSPLYNYGRVALTSLSGDREALDSALNRASQTLKQPTKPLVTHDNKGKIAVDPRLTSAVMGTVGGAGVALKARPIITSAAKKQVTNLDLAARSTTGVLDKIDPRLGDMVRQRRELGETGAAQAKYNLKVTNTLNKQEQTNLARVMKGTEQPLNDRVVAAARETRKVFDTAYFRAKNSGVPVAKYRKDYYPQILNPKALKEGSKQFDSQVQHLINTKQAKNGPEAISLLRKYKAGKSVSPYGNLAKSRSLDLTGYAESNSAIHQYIDRAYATIAHHKVMGPEDKVLNKVLDEVRQNGGDVEQAIKSYKQASGLTSGSDFAEKASRAATNVQGSTKLGLSSIGNVTQKTNNAVAGGVMREVKALVTQGTKANKDFIAKTGVRDEQVAHEALFGEQGVSSKVRKITAPGFERIEKSNRAEAALVGRDQAASLAKKAARGDVNAARKLRDDFGLDVPKNGKLSEADQIKAARKFVERTQFRTGTQDLPGWASSPTGRVVSQFRRYPYKQAQFLKKEVLDKAKQGDLMPFVRLATVGAPVGVGSQLLSNKIRGTDFNQSAPEKVLDVANDSTGASLATSLPQALYPSSQDANAYVSKVVKGLGGPTISDVTKGVQAGFDATKKNPTSAERLALGHVPVVGTPISSRALPYKKSTSKAKPGENSTIEQMDAQSKTEAADFKKKMKPGSYGLSQLSNGKYIYQVGNEAHTTSDLKEARKAIAEDSLKHSKDQIKIIGDTVYYKDSTGKVKSQSKVIYDWNQADSKNKLELDRAYEASDFNKWMDLAQKEYDALEAKKKFYNPATEQDKIDDIILQQENLMQKAEKYQEKLGQGKGFGAKKGSGSGSSGRSGGSHTKSAGSAYQYAVSPKTGVAAASPKITIRASGGSTKRAVRRSSRPKVTLKKSQV